MVASVQERKRAHAANRPKKDAHLSTFSEDAKDLYVRAGLMAVCAQLMELTEVAMT
jgi:hypothetical protein